MVMVSPPDIYEFPNYYDEEFYQETFYDVLENCVIPSVSSVLGTLLKIVAINGCLSIVVSTVKPPDKLFHILSGCCGIFLIITTLQSVPGKVLIFVIFTCSYFLLILSKVCKSYKAPHFKIHTFIKYGLIIFLVLCEHILLDVQTWLEIRGTIMVFIMKVISLTTDYESGDINFPNFYEYFGYVFCSGNVLFGPWINISMYNYQLRHPPKKNLQWMFGILRSIVYSLFFLIVSNCWSTYLIPEDSNRWLSGYREALSFRTSHYFISYLSEASMLAAGWKDSKKWFDESFHFTVTDPRAIEYPAALATVVIKWNKPMHEFLKRYVYKSWLPNGKFYAVLITFVMSSFLHGFESKVSVVLITLGFMSYIQLSVRDHISKALNCCVRVYPCKTCMHKNRRQSLLSQILILIFTSITVLHLIFVGVVMDPSTDEVGILAKWENLHFVSFWIIFVDLIIIGIGVTFS